VKTVDVEFNQLIEKLDQLEARRRKGQLLVWLPRGLLIGLLAAAVIAVFARYRPILFNQDVAWLAGLLASAGLIFSAIAILLQHRALIDRARFADRRYQLYDRASTAVEIQSGDLQAASDLGRLQLNDTIQAMKGLDIKGRQPLQLNRRDLVIIGIIGVLIIAAVLLPNPLERILAERRALEIALEEQIQDLEAVAEEIRSDPSLTAQQQDELLAPIEGAKGGLGDDEMSRERAVATLSETSGELRELLETYDNRALRDALDVVGDTLGENPLTHSLSQALREGQLAAASSSMNQLADDLPDLSPEQIEELAENLSDMAGSLDTLDPELANQISQAAQALESEDTAGAQEALRDSAATLARRSQEQAAAQRAASAVEQLEDSRGALAQAGGSASTSDEGQGDLQSGSGQEAGGSTLDPGPGSQTEQGDGAGGPGPGGGPAENVFVPDFMDLAAEGGIEVELPANCTGDPERCGQLLNQTPTIPGDERSLIPYDQVYGNYRDTAYQALESEHIPLGLRGYVRDYFSSLEP
jgi:hypothetical protein